MDKLKTLDELRNLRARILHAPHKDRPCLVVCAGTGGQASGADSLIRVVKREILQKSLQARLSLRITGCQGFREMVPVYSG